MTFAPSVTDDMVFAALGAFCTAVLACPVVQGQANRAAEPGVPDFVVMWPTGRGRLSTNHKLAVPPVAPAPAPGAVVYTQPTEITVQMDAHGEAGADNAQTLTTLFRSSYAVDQMGPVVVPLFATDPQQMPFLNGEGQYEDRWMFHVHLQINPAVSTPVEFADTLTPIVAIPADIRRVA